MFEQKYENIKNFQLKRASFSKLTDSQSCSSRVLLKFFVMYCRFFSALCLGWDSYEYENS